MNTRRAVLVSEQLVVSGCNFLTAILLARALTATQLGVWAVCTSIALYIGSIGIALVHAPLQILIPQSDATRKSSIVRGSLALQIVLTLALSGTLIGLAAALNHTTHISFEFRDSLALAAFTFTIQLLEWFRRVCHALERSEKALTCSVIGYVSSLLCTLLLFDRLTPSLFFSLSAICNAIALCWATYSIRVYPSWGEWAKISTNFLHLGRRYFLAGQLQWLGGQGATVVTSTILGAPEAGTLRAVQTLLSPLNVAFQVLDNHLPVRAARVAHLTSDPETRKYLWRGFFRASIPSGLFLLLISAFASPLLSIFYGAYSEHGVLVSLNAAALFIALAVRFATYYRRIKNELDVLVTANLGWAIVTVVSSAILGTTFGLNGVMTGAILGGVTALIICVRMRSTEAGRAQ